MPWPSLYLEQAKHPPMFATRQPLGLRTHGRLGERTAGCGSRHAAKTVFPVPAITRSDSAAKKAVGTTAYLLSRRAAPGLNHCQCPPDAASHAPGRAGSKNPSSRRSVLTRSPKLINRCFAMLWMGRMRRRATGAATHGHPGTLRGDPHGQPKVFPPPSAREICF